MKYKISIVIPVFNVENYIKNALDSIINQTIGLEDLEVIIINDCSTDNSRKIIDEYANKYENFVAIHLHQNSGTPGKPRNIGIENANGDYIMFLDPDDCYANDTCEVLYNKIKSEDVDIVFGKYIIFNVENKNKVVYNFLNDVEEIKVKNIDDDPRLLKLAPSIWTKIYKRTFIQDNNLRFPLEIVIGEDLAFMVDSFLKANGIIFLNNYYCYYYRIRNAKGEESITNKINKENLMGAADGYYKTYDILKNNGKEEYFPSIIKSHLEYWADGFIRSNTKPSEKKEVLEKIGYLFEKLKINNINPEKKYLIPLFNSIGNKEYHESILLAKILDEFIKHRQDLQKQILELQKQRKLELQKYNEELDLKKKQIAELQAFRGYCGYKTKNITMRIKNRVKMSPKNKKYDKYKSDSNDYNMKVRRY